MRKYEDVIDSVNMTFSFHKWALESTCENVKSSSEIGIFFFLWIVKRACVCMFACVFGCGYLCVCARVCVWECVTGSHNDQWFGGMALGEQCRDNRCVWWGTDTPPHLLDPQPLISTPLWTPHHLQIGYESGHLQGSSPFNELEFLLYMFSSALKRGHLLINCLSSPMREESPSRGGSVTLQRCQFTSPRLSPRLISVICMCVCTLHTALYIRDISTLLCPAGIGSF